MNKRLKIDDTRAQVFEVLRSTNDDTARALLIDAINSLDAFLRLETVRQNYTGDVKQLDAMREAGAI